MGFEPEGMEWNPYRADEPFDVTAGRLGKAATSFLDKVVLAALALQVHLDLALCRLAHVDDGHAAQHIGW